MNETIEIIFLNKEKKSMNATITIVKNTNTLTLNNFYSNDYSFEGNDYSESLRRMREFIESEGCALLCNGCRENISISRMSKQMSNGRKAYIVKIGEPANQNSMVDIFQPIQKNQFSTIDQQNKFHMKWIKSLTKAE